MARLMVVASKSHRDQATDDYINKYAVKDMKSAGSSLKFCLIATGEADIIPACRPDDGMGHRRGSCGSCTARAARWCASMITARRCIYGKEGYANPFFIAYSPDVSLKSA